MDTEYSRTLNSKSNTCLIKLKLFLGEGKPIFDTNEHQSIRVIEQVKRYSKHIAAVCSVALFSTQSMANHDALHDISRHHLLLELTPAMCALYPIRASSKQCLNKYHVTTVGLDLGYHCTSSDTPIISPVQRRVLQRFMPDDLYVDQAWRRYGACSPYDDRRYFRQLVTSANKVNIPLRLNNRYSYIISKSQFYQDMQRANPTLTSNSMQLTCEKSNLSQPILTKIKICYGETDFTECPQIEDNCGDNFVVWGSFQ